MWSGFREAFGVVVLRRNLARTVLTALIVGTVLFAINQLDVVLRGRATAFVWFKTGLTYFVPFAVSNVGILFATHRRSQATEIRAGDTEAGGACMITVTRRDVPALTADQMRDVDRAMVEDLRIELVQMMENAGRGLAELALARFSPASVTVLAGPGGNGGGGMVAARHLANRGCAVSVVLSAPNGLTAVPAHQADILTRMGVAMVERPASAQLVVDALIGYSLRGNPEGRAAELIEWANSQPAPILALDTPSGLDVTTGLSASPTVRATATLTLALPKVGLLDASTVGELYLADISVPAQVYEQMGISPPQMFRAGAVIRLGP
jgi:NAD(P)H-hydrate epimerase